MDGADDSAGLILRPPDTVMRLARLGSFHQTRLSFLRVLLRRAVRDQWEFARPRFEFDARGVGTAVYTVRLGSGGTVSLVAFGHDLPAASRTDRVIAEAWDATFVLFDGIPTEPDLDRLRANVPLQEAGRYLKSELVLARANRSVRLFDHVVTALASGHQPETVRLGATGYLMRTTAVYGSGKFGIADRDVYKSRYEFAAPFQAEMLTVYLIRTFTVELVEHMARLRAPGLAVPLAPDAARHLGIGNATGLGMAPFLIRHPTLIDRWITARETALARVRAQPSAGTNERSTFLDCIALGRRHIEGWHTDDSVQAPRIHELKWDLDRLGDMVQQFDWAAPAPWDRLYRWASQHLSIEGQEFTVTLLIEPHGAIVDVLAEDMASDEAANFPIAGRQTCGALRSAIEENYGWALAIDFDARHENAKFWYVSEEKLEPRIGERECDDGATLEQPLAVGRDVSCLYRTLCTFPDAEFLGTFLNCHPEFRHVVRRIGHIERHPYSEIRDNLIAAGLRPVDILRSKLSFFGATRFDPKSDKWLRITLFQNAPFAHELQEREWDGWIWSGP